MDCDNICSSTNEILDMLFRICNHQMTVKHQFAMWTHASYNTRSKGDIRNKVAVHYVNMSIVSSSRF